MITVKGHPIDELEKGDSSFRRAQKFRNEIVSNLGRMGVHEDDIEIPMERVPIRRGPASVSWWLHGEHCYFSYGQRKSFLENLYVVSKVIDSEAFLWDEDELEPEDVATKYAQPEDIEIQLATARALLGVDVREHDLELIRKKFQALLSSRPEDAQDLQAAFGLIESELTY